MKKMLPWLITTLLAISLIAVVAVFLWNSVLGDPKTAEGEGKPAVAAAAKPMSAEERLGVTLELKDIKRNLKDEDKLVIISFAFQLDKKAAKEELDQIKDIAVKPIINRILADTAAADLQGSAGQDALEAKLLNEVNKILPEGKLVKVSITDYLLTDI
ncbi:flagellar basal body-associated FliL family protein [Paenibacillus pasadenensis]|uniref:Flagellar protein FliL n=1 Tax=Paenibacillus pasadenensis TaxID=217090 RepID=A0A2N5N777_9BACL|nr:MULTISPECIES: flagellar basal body-associated FliL family protein [Paenibacillus]PLT46192.1 Flagellar biosynthesis protein FliL [Paenibacillus pasadenensis]QGG56653.1 flagellar basal body protein FliL [Paenibacillus sp. B01]